MDGVAGVSEVEEVVHLVGEEPVEGEGSGVVVAELHLEEGCESLVFLVGGFCYGVFRIIVCGIVAAAIVVGR